VSALLGGEASSAEVQAAAAAAWGVLQQLPPPEQLQGRGSAAAMEPIRCWLVLGVLPRPCFAWPVLTPGRSRIIGMQHRCSGFALAFSASSSLQQMRRQRCTTANFNTSS